MIGEKRDTVQDHSLGKDIQTVRRRRSRHCMNACHGASKHIPLGRYAVRAVL